MNCIYALFLSCAFSCFHNSSNKKKNDRCFATNYVSLSSLRRTSSDPSHLFLGLHSSQILFVVGLAFVIGLERTFRFFFQKHKMKATIFFLGGVLVVLIGWPIVGVVLEFYGFFLLFRYFFTGLRSSYSG